MTNDGIYIRVLGDYGPFSTMGKSIGYQVTIGQRSFLIDCGAPLFQQIGGHGLKTIGGLIITHCHDDHKRWFSDLALFNMYALDIKHKVMLYTSERVNDDLRIATSPALETSLASDAKTIVDRSYDDYIAFNPLGPRTKFRIVSIDNGAGVSTLGVADREGHLLGPERAKIVISAINGKTRLLFFDPDYQEWIEPESFYSFSSPTFYEADTHLYHDPAGFTIEALNAPVWHGVPSIGLRFRTASETLVFSADTAHDIELWQKLAEEKRPQRLTGSREEFAAATILHGDINDYIERIWSRERYQEALAAFGDGGVIHDIASKKSIVHTDYCRLNQTVLQREKTLLTHSPDKITSAWALSKADKLFRVKGGRFQEIVDGQAWPLDAAIYHKEAGKFYVGYVNAGGKVTIYNNDGLLNLGGPYNWQGGDPLYTVDFYEDVGGHYLPMLEKESTHYLLRSDGQVELVTHTESGSHGVIVPDQRPRLSCAVSNVGTMEEATKNPI